MTDQAVPFQSSMSGTPLSSTTEGADARADPTAIQKVASAHETAESSFGEVATAGETETVQSFGGPAAAAPGVAWRAATPIMVKRAARAAIARKRWLLLWGTSRCSIHLLIGHVVSASADV
jgi:hypothetical protein